MSAVTWSIVDMPEIEVAPYERLVDFVCITCGKPKSRVLPVGQTVRYCSESCRRRSKRARHQASRITREGNPQLGLPGFPDPARWLLAVRQRMIGGSVVGSRLRCETTGKVAYHSMAEAWVTAFADFADTPTLNAYLCDACRGYHLGNKKAWTIRQLRRRVQREIDRARRQLLLGGQTMETMDRRDSATGEGIVRPAEWTA